MEANNLNKRNSFHEENEIISNIISEYNVSTIYYKNKFKKMVNSVPLYLNNIDKKEFFFDKYKKDLKIEKKEYISICSKIHSLMTKLKALSNDKKSRLLSKILKYSIMGCLGSGIVISLVIIGGFDKIGQDILIIFLMILFTINTAFMLLFVYRNMIKIRFNEVKASSIIRELNIFLSKVNIKYKNLDIVFTLKTKSNELFIVDKSKMIV